MKNNFTAPLFNYLALSLIFSFLILCEVKGQCPPEVIGPQSSCNPICAYTITNFNQTQANNYSWSLYNAAGTLIQPTVIGMSSFTFFPTATNNYQLIVSYNSSTCNSTNNTTIIDIYSCCEPSIPLPINQRVNDATQTSIIGWSGTATIIKNKIIVFGGNIEINNSIDFEN